MFVNPKNIPAILGLSIVFLLVFEVVRLAPPPGGQRNPPAPWLL